MGEVDNIFSGVFGDNHKTRIIDFLVTGRNFDYTITDISEGTEIGRKYIYPILLKDLIKSGIVKKTRKIGTSTLFKINKDSKLVKTLIKFYGQLLASNN